MVIYLILAHVLENQFFSILKDRKIDGILVAGTYLINGTSIEAIELWIPSLPVSLWIISTHSLW